MKNFYLTIVLFLIFVNVLKAELPQSEKNALLAIAESLHFPSNWNTGTPFEQWSGIEISSVNGNDHVTGFVVTRTLPTSIQNINFSSQVQNLTHLKKLNLSFLGNSTSEIIFDFQHISNLNYLEDFAFVVSSTDPTNNFILLNNNSITNISSLRSLKFNFHSTIFELPSNISNLTNLKHLTYNNEKKELPNNIYNLLNLEELYLNSSVISYYPEYFNDLINLTNLKTLSVFVKSQSPPITLPDVLYNLPSVEELHITLFSNNVANLHISDEISNYSNQLKRFTLTADMVTYTTSLLYLNSLEYLGISSRQYMNSLTNEIENLQNLKILSIESPYIYIPSKIKNLQQLEELFIKTFQTFNYEYPVEMFEIPNLKLFLADFKDVIPENIGNLQNVEHIQITLNKEFYSPLPESIANLSSLKKLDIFYDFQAINHFNIPENYFNLNQLEQFWFRGKFNLNVTNKFLNLPNLKTLALDNFTGGNLSGTLNLCQNPNINILEVSNSTINKIDLRNNQPIANGELRWISLYNNPITNFYVDDVNVFQNLIDVNKVRINDNTQNYQISTSAEPCARVLGNTEITQNNKSKIFPNPVKDFIQFEADKTISDVEITNMAGQKFNLDVVFDNKVNASYLPKGVYVIKYKANGVYYLDKFIKN